MTDVHAPCLKQAAARDALAVRKEPYWNILEYGRHIGLRKLHPEVQYWVARTRMQRDNQPENPASIRMRTRSGGS